MFMYASALGIALTNKRTLRVHPFVKKMNSNFNLSSEWVNSAEPNIYSTLHHPKCCKYYEETGRLPNDRFALYGYYQSWKYFHKYKDLILREFSFSNNINIKAQVTWYKHTQKFHFKKKYARSVPKETFLWGGLNTNVGHHGWPTIKTFKITLVKTP